MIPTVRIYTSEEDGHAAAREAEEAGFESVCCLLPAEVAGREREAVRAGVDAQCIGGSQARACVEALGRGQAVVGVYAPFMRGEEAQRILDRHGPAEVVEYLQPSDPAPFSRIFGLPVLSDSPPMTELSIVKYTLGEPRLSRNPTPLSSLVGLKPLTKPKRKTSSLGLPLLSGNPAPLSSLLRLPLLSRSTRKSSSFGLPLLSKNPTPLSSLFGMRVLSKKDRDRS